LRGHTKILPLALGAIMLTAGCGAQAADATTWGTVNGHPITQAEVTARMDVIKVLDPQAASQIKQRSTWVSETKELATEYLLAQEAAKAGFKVSQKEIKASQSQLQSYLVSSYGSQSALQKALKKDGATQQDLNTYAASAALLQGYLAKVAPPQPVTQADVKAFYQANKSQFAQPEEYDLAHILVNTKAQADQILAQLQAGASFATLAKKYSTDTGSAKNGGDLGYQPLSTYVTAFAQAAAKLTKVGQLSPVVHSKFGYHIIKLLGVKPPSTQPLSAVQSEIQAYLQQQNSTDAVNTYLTKITAKAKITTNLPKTVP
jgi:foldase protein PrsA